MQEAIRVLIVDDEPKLCAAWERLISGQSDMVCVGVLPNADDIDRAATKAGAGVVLMDLTMPGDDPLSAVAAMSAARRPARVLVYSGRSEPGLIQKALDAGAWGYVDKLASPSDILSALRRVAAGEMVFPAGSDG